MDIILFIQTVIMGIVQGITEWLPISSTGHMILFDEFMKMNVSDTFMETFLVVIQLGSILAVVVLYFSKLNPFVAKSDRAKNELLGHLPIKYETIKLYLKICAAGIPAGIIGITLGDWIDAHFYNAFTVAFTLIIYGVWFIVIENRKKPSKISSIEEIDYKTAFLIGAFQVLALIPGTSRSGSTIIGATLLGCSRVAAAEFSFFLAVPIMIGASGIKLLKSGFALSPQEWQILILGMIVAFVVSVFAIKFLMGYIRKRDFKGFGYYRIVLGILLIIYFVFIK